jgi:hypothetical protein
VEKCTQEGALAAAVSARPRPRAVCPTSEPSRGQASSSVARWNSLSALSARLLSYCCRRRGRGRVHRPPSNTGRVAFFWKLHKNCDPRLALATPLSGSRQGAWVVRAGAQGRDRGPGRARRCRQGATTGTLQRHFCDNTKSLQPRSATPYRKGAWGVRAGVLGIDTGPGRARHCRRGATMVGRPPAASCPRPSGRSPAVPCKVCASENRQACLRPDHDPIASSVAAIQETRKGLKMQDHYSS